MGYHKKEYENNKIDNRKYPVYRFNRFNEDRRRNIKKRDAKREERLERRLKVD